MSCENKAYSYHVSVIFDKKECSDDDPVLDRLNDDGKITDIIGNSLRNNLSNIKAIHIVPVPYQNTFIFKWDDE